MICFIFIIIGITHVFADEKAKITQVVMDKDVGARLDEGDSVNQRQSRRGNGSACMACEQKSISLYNRNCT
mgnify:CR=1 FL=1